MFRKKELTLEELEAVKRAKLQTAQETGYFTSLSEMEELNIKIELAKLREGKDKWQILLQKMR